MDGRDRGRSNCKYIKDSLTLIHISVTIIKNGVNQDAIQLPEANSKIHAAQPEVMALEKTFVAVLICRIGTSRLAVARPPSESKILCNKTTSLLKQPGMKIM